MKGIGDMNGVAAGDFGGIEYYGTHGFGNGIAEYPARPPSPYCLGIKGLAGNCKQQNHTNYSLRYSQITIIILYLPIHKSSIYF